MGYGPAVLSGLLSGLSGLPQGMQAATNEDLARQRLGMEQQQLEQQQRQFDQSRTLDLSQYQPVLKAAGLDLTGLPAGPTPLPIAELLFKNAQVRAEQQRKAGLTEQLGKALEPGMQTVTPGTTFESAPSPLAPRPAAPMSAVATPEDPMAKLRRVLPILSQIDPAGAAKAAMDLAVPQNVAVPDTSTLRNKLTGEPVGPQGPAQPFTPAPGSRAIPTVGPKGNVTTTRYEPAPWNQQLAEKALADEGWTPEMPGYYKALYMAMTPLTPITEGGGAVPRTFTIPPPPTGGPRPAGGGAAVTPGPAGGGRPQFGPTRLPGGGIQGPPKSTPEAQIKEFEAIDLARGQINELLRLAPKVNLPQITGGLAPWVNSIIQTGKVGPVPVPPEIIGQLTPDQSRFLAMLQDYADQVLRLRSGAQINELEMKRMLGFLGSEQIRPDVLIPRLQLQLDFLKAKREAKSGAVSGSGYRVPPPTVPTFPTIPGGGAAPPAPPTAPPQQGLLQKALPWLFGGQQGGYQEGKLYQGSDGKMYRYQGGKMVPQ